MKPYGVVLLGMLMLACSSSGDGGGGGPVQQCEALLDVTCDRTMECVPGGYPSKADCLADVKTIVTCADATSVGDGYPDCMSTMELRPCSDLFPGGTLDLPSVCSGVINYD